MEQNIGGNIIKSFTLDEKYTLFANDAYKYFKTFLEDGETYKVSNLPSYTVFVMDIDKSGSIDVEFDGTIHNIEAGQAVIIENKDVILKSHGTSLLFIAGVKERVYDDSKVSILKNDEIKFVKKPWGYEKWINGEHNGYAFKNIYIKKGTCTSLQYHEMKRETNILFDGKALLHYKNNEDINNDDVQDKDVSQFELSPNNSVDVWPNILHRLEAVSDIMLFEVSTPHLDDVIRVQDSSNRSSGRIESEHA
jgi:mannose-6-phosphate isomerase